MKLGRDEVLISRSRAEPKQVTGGPLFQRTSSYRKATGTNNNMHSNDLEACGVVWFHSEVKFMMCLWRLFGLKSFWPILIKFL